MPPELTRTTRDAVHRWLVTIGAASIGAAILEAPRSLADPASCPGLLELAAVIGSRTASDVSVATLLLWGNRLATLAALVLFGRLLQAIGSGLVATAAVTFALAATPWFAPVLAPAPAAAIGAAAAALLLMHRAVSAGRRGLLPTIAACLAIALVASIAPALTLPAAMVAAMLAWTTMASTVGRGRILASIVAAATVAILPIAVVLVLPPLPLAHGAGASALACLVPAVRPVGTAAGSVAGVLGGIAPLALGLAVLGAFASRDRLADRRMWPALAFAIAPLVSAWSADDLTRTIAPTAVAVWCLTALGLRELDTTLVHRPARRVIVLLLTMAVPWLQHAREAPRDEPDAARVRGHDRLTRASFTDLAGELPGDAALVAEDAITDVLARDVFRRLQRRGKALRVVAREPQAAAAALESMRVFALPRGQSELRHEAFRLTTGGATTVTGLAEIHRSGRCEVVPREWSDLAGLQQAAGLAAVSSVARARWQVVVYMTAGAPIQPRADHWPARSGLGYHARGYDRESDADLRWLREDMTVDAVPASHPVFAARHIARLEIWRAPGAPDILPVVLSAAPDRLVARTRADAGDAEMRLCPSFPFDVGEIGVR